MTSLNPSVLKVIGRGLLGVVLISLCYFTAFLFLFGLSDPFSAGQPRMSSAALIIIASIMAVVVWSASGFVIGKFMMTPRRKTSRPWMAYVYAAILLTAIVAFLGYLTHS